MPPRPKMNTMFIYKGGRRPPWSAVRRPNIKERPYRIRIFSYHIPVLGKRQMRNRYQERHIHKYKFYIFCKHITARSNSLEIELYGSEVNKIGPNMKSSSITK